MELTQKARKLIDAIEACGASIELTHAVTLAGELATDIEFEELYLMAMKKGWVVPGPNDPSQKHSWNFYWQRCQCCEKDPTRGCAIPPHR